jgi:hypothetical protein
LPHLYEERRSRDTLGDSATLGHGFECRVAQSFNHQVVTELPHADENFVRRHVLKIGEDLTREHVVLHVTKHLGHRIGYLDDALDRLFIILVLKEELSVVSRPGAEKVKLQAKGLLLGTNKDNNKDRVRFAGWALISGYL